SNIWLGTETNGASRVTPYGFTAFRESDGLKKKYVRQVFETRDNEIVAITSATERAYLTRDRFVPLQLNIAPELLIEGILGRGTPFQDHTGEWWIDAKN